MSLWQYFHHEHNEKLKHGDTYYIPYATGLNSRPTYPVTSSYARGSLIKHYPWSQHNLLHIGTDDDAMNSFREFIQDDNCPSILRLEFKRAKSHYDNRRKHVEPTNTNIEPNCGIQSSSNEHIDDNDEYETQCVVKAMNSVTKCMQHEFVYKGETFDKGIHHEWDIRLCNRDPMLRGKTWLYEQIKIQEQKHNNDLNIPHKQDGSTYELNDLTDEQACIAYMVMTKVFEWMNFPAK